MKVVYPSYVIETELDGNEILGTIEKIGRTCYKSEDRITYDSSRKFVATLIKNGHEAMLEHISFTVRFICDRGISHEIVRHRIGSYAQESTRYCNYSDAKFDSEINAIDITGGIYFDTKMKDLFFDNIDMIILEWLAAMEDAQRHYMQMISLGATPQIARGVLPTSLKTEIVVTMNLREWRHFFKLRTAPAAHPQLREITIPLLKELKEKIPVIFDDIEVE